MKHKDIEIADDFSVEIGADTYGSDTLEDARALIDDVLERSFYYRGVLVAPSDVVDDDDALGFVIGGKAYRVGIEGEECDAAREVAEAIIDRLLD